VINRKFDDETEDKPLDPAVEAVRRKLVRFVGINLGLLFLAVMAVVVAIVYRTRTVETPPADIAAPPTGEMAAGEIDLPDGARIVSQSLSGNRIAIDAELPGGGHAIFLYDTLERRIVGRFEVK